jgi:hypothetical protein
VTTRGSGGGRARALLVSALVMLAASTLAIGCGSAADPLACVMPCRPDFDRDASVSGSADGGAIEPSIDGGARGAPALEDQEGYANAGECFDGRNDDDWGGTDCEEALCASTPVCCVGVASTSCCSAATEAARFARATDCVDGSIDACPSALTSGTLFGSPLPALEDGALVPNGSDTRDSGMILSGRVRPSAELVTLEARIAAPVGCAPCLDAIGVGLVAGARSVDTARITPVIALVVSGSRGEVSLVAGSTVLWRHPLPDESEHAYSLAIAPGGGVVIGADFLDPAERTIELPAGELDVVVYGRTTNRSATDGRPARLLGLEVERSACDIPESLERAPAVLIEPDSAPWGAGRARGPSIVIPPGGSALDGALVFAASGAIWLAHRDGTGRFAVADGIGPALPRGVLGFSEPELLAVGDRYRLFVTATDASGHRKIQYVDGASGLGEQFDPGSLVDLIALPTADGITDLDGASAITVGSEIVIAARALRGSGPRASELVILRSSPTAAGGFELDGVCGTGCESVEGEGAGTLAVHQPSADAVAFDHDEVASPGLVEHGGVFRLYYAGRRGTRWAIGMLVSQDLAFFRAALGNPVLEASGQGADALSVGDPEPHVEGGALMLLHTGYDGSATRVLAATQPLR